MAFCISIIVVGVECHEAINENCPIILYFQIFLPFRSNTSFEIILKLVMLEGIIAQYLLLRSMPMDTSSLFSVFISDFYATVQH